MGQAIGGSLPLAIGVALSPVAIIAVVLMLTTEKARVNDPAFVLGWLIGLGVVGAADLLGKLEDWIGQHNAVIMTVLCLIIGVKLIGDAISALT